MPVQPSDRTSSEVTSRVRPEISGSTAAHACINRVRINSDHARELSPRVGIGINRSLVKSIQVAVYFIQVAPGDFVS